MVPGTLDGYDDDDEGDAAVDDDDEVRRDAPAITSGQFLFHGVLSFVPLAFCVLSSRHYRSLRFPRRLRVSSVRLCVAASFALFTPYLPEESNVVDRSSSRSSRFLRDDSQHVGCSFVPNGSHGEAREKLHAKLVINVGRFAGGFHVCTKC